MSVTIRRCASRGHTKAVVNQFIDNVTAVASTIVSSVIAGCDERFALYTLAVRGNASEATAGCDERWLNESNNGTTPFIIPSVVAVLADDRNHKLKNGLSCNATLPYWIACSNPRRELVCRGFKEQAQMVTQTKVATRS